LNKRSLLKGIFLRLALTGFFFFARLFGGFYVIAHTITMQPGLIDIGAKVRGNVMPVKLKARKNK
jgi:hypothetical protein